MYIRHTLFIIYYLYIVMSLSQMSMNVCDMELNSHTSTGLNVMF